MKRYYIAFVFILTLIVSCEKDGNPPVFAAPDVNRNTCTKLSYHNVTIVDTLTMHNEGVAVRLFYSTDSKIGTTECSGEVKSVAPSVCKEDDVVLLTSEITDLQDNTTYYYVYGFMSEYNKERKKGLVTLYSAVRSFTTLKNQPPDVRTEGSSEIGFYTATLSVEKVSDNSDSPTTDWGVCYSVNSNPTISDNKIKYPTNYDRAVNFQLKGLSIGTTYYYRAYGINKYGTSYGEEKSFTTISATAMDVVTREPTEICSTDAILAGKITTEAGVNVTERGFCISSTDSVPDDKARVLVSTTKGEGAYQYYADGLTASTKYYVRAYSICQYGKIYGNVIAFTTEH